MRIIKWILSLAVLIVIVAVAGGYIFLRNFDLNKYKDYASRLVYEQTGRKLVINGNAELGVSLIPTLVINDVTLSNPEWAKNPEMLKLGTLELKLSIMPLFRKQIVLDKIILQQPQIYLETSADGKNSWDFSAPAKTTAAVLPSGNWLVASAYAAEMPVESKDNENLLGSISDIVARQAEIDKGTITYYDGKAKKAYTVQINKISLSTEGLSSPVAASWDISYDGINTAGKGTLGALRDLLNNQPDYPVQLDFAALGMNMNVDATLSDWKNALKSKFNLRLKNPSGNMNAPAIALNCSGTADLKNVAVNIDSLDVAGNVVKGKASVSLAQKLPYITADLQSDFINLPSLTAVPKKTAFRWPEIVASAYASQLVPDTPIPYELLKIANAKINATIKKLTVNEAISAENVKLSAVLDKGNLRVRPLDLQFGNGTVNLLADINAAQQSVSFQLNGKDILLQNIHKEFAVDGAKDFGFLSGGQTTLYADLAGKGSTIRRVVDSLSGQFVAIVGKSEIQSGQLRFLTNNFIVQLLSILKIDTSKADQINLKCAVVRSDLKDGKAIFPKGIAMDSNQLTLVSNGKINLVNDNLNLTLNAYRNGMANLGIVQTLSSLVKIGGTLQNPAISLDTGGAVKTIAGVVAGGPAALGANILLDRDSAPCYTALQGTAYADMFPKPSGVSGAAQNTYQGTSQAVKDGVNGLKDSAKKLLNFLK